MTDVMKAPTQADDWPSFLTLLEPYVARATWIPERFKTDPQLRQELNAFLSSINAMVYFKTWYNDPRYPDLWPCYHSAFPIGFNNPDDVYQIAAIDDDGVYRIFGHRGTVRILTFEVGSSTMQVWGYGPYGRTLSEYEPDVDATINEDGTFDVLLSADRPDGYEGDWWELRPGSQYVFVRKRAYDWLGELDARIAIERLDVPALRSRRSAAEIERRVELLHVSHENWSRKMLEWFTDLDNQELVNVLRNKYVHGGGIRSQIYPQGIYEIAPDEALILETDVPDCKYWMFHVTDQMMTTIDQINRPTSINGYQARLDGDGCFRAVISVTDPGVPNWLDTGGHLRGAISGRWWAPSREPQTTLTRVPLAEIRAYLPEETPVVTFEEREASVRTRRRGAQLRIRW